MLEVGAFIFVTSGPDVLFQAIIQLYIELLFALPRNLSSYPK